MLRIVETYNSKGEIITDKYKITMPELEEFLTEVCQRIENVSTEQGNE